MLIYSFIQLSERRNIQLLMGKNKYRHNVFFSYLYFQGYLLKEANNFPE